MFRKAFNEGGDEYIIVVKYILDLFWYKFTVCVKTLTFILFFLYELNRINIDKHLHTHTWRKVIYRREGSSL